MGGCGPAVRCTSQEGRGPVGRMAHGRSRARAPPLPWPGSASSWHRQNPRNDAPTWLTDRIRLPRARAFPYMAPSFRPVRDKRACMAAKPVAIIMGSQSDWPTMRHAAETLDALSVGYDKRIVSAHRTPDRLYSFARGAKA